MQTRIKMRRRGEFDVRGVNEDQNQCGIVGLRHFHYAVELECLEADLDPRGFIMDQLEIHDLMVRIHEDVSTLTSCEGMAIRACKLVREALTVPAKVSVSIGGTEWALMTATIE